MQLAWYPPIFDWSSTVGQGCSPSPDGAIHTPRADHTVTGGQEGVNGLRVAWVTVGDVSPQAPVEQQQTALPITTHHLPPSLCVRVCVCVCVHRTGHKDQSHTHLHPSSTTCTPMFNTDYTMTTYLHTLLLFCVAQEK